jgi:hypothetical protein
MKFPIEAPASQNWSCHGCTNCCREFMVVELSDEERQRIEMQEWKESDGVDPKAIIVSRDAAANEIGPGAPAHACVYIRTARLGSK